MKTLVQEGHVITVVASGTVAAGAGVLTSQLFGVAVNGVSSGDLLQVRVTGVVTIAKQPNVGFSVGDAVYWDSGNGYVDATSTSQKEIGYCVKGANATDATVDVLLIPTIRTSVAA